MNPYRVCKLLLPYSQRTIIAPKRVAAYPLLILTWFFYLFYMLAGDNFHLTLTLQAGKLVFLTDFSNEFSLLFYVRLVGHSNFHLSTCNVIA